MHDDLLKECSKRDIVILRLFKDELSRAKTLYPDFPVDPIHAAAIVGEQAGELLQAALKFNYQDYPYSNMLKEAVHTGAMAMRFISNMCKMEGV